MTTKAIRTLYALFRNVHISHPIILLKLYKTYVLPHLEYCSQIWNPCHKKHIQQIEIFQKKFARLLYYRAFPNPNYLKAMPGYKTRLQQIGLKTFLQENFHRRFDGIQSSTWRNMFKSF